MSQTAKPNRIGGHVEDLAPRGDNEAYERVRRGRLGVERGQLRPAETTNAQSGRRTSQ
jgi:hypothetical protein